MPVLDAAAKYDMKGVVGSLGVQLMRGMPGDALMYQDPLWVYCKAKQLDLADLAKAAANATLTIDLSKAPRKPEVANAPASWILDLVTLRARHSHWWRTTCQQSIRIAKMNKKYEATSEVFSFYRRTGCQCPQPLNLASADTITPRIEIVQEIMEYPCAESVRKIDFNRIIGCLRCGAAATAHYRKVCLLYEKEFGES
jgi:hypothetical protein